MSKALCDSRFSEPKVLARPSRRASWREHNDNAISGLLFQRENPGRALVKKCKHPQNSHAVWRFVIARHQRFFFALPAVSTNPNTNRKCLTRFCSSILSPARRANVNLLNFFFTLLACAAINATSVSCDLMLRLVPITFLSHHIPLLASLSPFPSAAFFSSLPLFAQWTTEFN